MGDSLLIGSGRFGYDALGGCPCAGKGLTIVDDWAAGGWTLIVGSYVYVSACGPASVCNSACACNVGADWREGEGYGECLEEAATAPPRVREREVLESSRASCLVKTFGGRLDRRGANGEILGVKMREGRRTLI